MPTLEHDDLVFRFPEIEPDASLSIEFMRTFRVPDTERDYALPPGFGSFPLRHVDDHLDRLPQETVERGGVLLPMWQAEALWMRFETGWDARLPVAIKVAAGKINAVTGEPWSAGLHRNPQDYLVAPDQPWLDGFAVEKGVVRQFVAMPLGEGYSAEEQLTGQAVWGGLQISVTPLKRERWLQIKRPRELRMHVLACASSRLERRSEHMALSPGGRIRQTIEEDRFRLTDWDQTATQRVFVSLVHAADWKRITGEPAPQHPPTAQDYARAGLPWFEWYGRDQNAVEGGAALAGLQSVGQLHKKKTGASLPWSEDVEDGPVVPLGPGAKTGKPVRTSDAW